jgi:hypothetical protein
MMFPEWFDDLNALAGDEEFIGHLEGICNRLSQMLTTPIPSAERAWQEGYEAALNHLNAHASYMFSHNAEPELPTNPYASKEDPA